MITADRAARRYLQMREIDQAIQACDKSIHEVQGEVDKLKERLSELRSTKFALLGDMRQAVRDQGDLPLIDLMIELAGAELEKARKH